jgi:hypothetical protein
VAKQNGADHKERLMPKETARIPKSDPAAEEIEKLRNCHRLGQTLLDEFPERDVYGTGMRQKWAEELGVDVGDLVHLRLFARRYSDRDLAELLAQQASASRPLGWSHLRQLVDVPDPELRASLQTAAAGEGWTVARLREEIRVTQGRRHGGGRRLHRPSTIERALLQLAERGDLLRRYLELFVLGDDPVLTAGRRPRKTKDRRKRRELLDGAEKTLTGLRREIG